MYVRTYVLVRVYTRRSELSVGTADRFVGTAACHGLAFTQYCYCQYCMV